MTVVENESVTLAAVSKQENFSRSRKIAEKLDNRMIAKAGSSRGPAVRLTPVRLEACILLLALIICSWILIKFQSQHYCGRRVGEIVQQDCGNWKHRWDWLLWDWKPGFSFLLLLLSTFDKVLEAGYRHRYCIYNFLLVEEGTGHLCLQENWWKWR